MARKRELPGWFPFAIVASGLVAIGAGIKSGWKGIGSSVSPPQNPQPGPARAGVWP